MEGCTNSISKGCLLYKQHCKNSLEQSCQCLAYKNTAMQKTHEELLSNTEQFN